MGFQVIVVEPVGVVHFTRFSFDGRQDLKLHSEPVKAASRFPPEKLHVPFLPFQLADHTVVAVIRLVPEYEFVLFSVGEVSYRLNVQVKCMFLCGRHRQRNKGKQNSRDTVLELHVDGSPAFPSVLQVPADSRGSTLNSFAICFLTASRSRG